MAYNNFGLTTDDIKNAYIGTDFSDFDGGDDFGEARITREMELSLNKITSRLGARTIRLLSFLPYVQAQTRTDGADTKWDFPFNPLLTSTNNKAYIMSKNHDDDCPTVTIPDSYAVSFTVGLSGSTYVGSTAATFDPENQFIYFSFDVDQTTLNVPSLSSLLRDTVCCKLGFSLYAQGENQWSAVTNFCEESKEGLDLLTDTWVPPELKALKWLKAPWSTPGMLVPIRILRT